jgi:anhydro-N-acetylmuramic acid kinase
MIVVGLMSGTSADAIDTASVDLRLEDSALVARPIGARSSPYPESVRELLDEVVRGGPMSTRDVCRLDTGVGRAFAVAAAEWVEAEGGELVVSHGQTVHHWVEDGRVRGTLQLGQPAWIAERTGLPVVSDLRARDVAAGGHGAPLVSLVDALLLDGVEEAEAALNLGGIANVTVVAPGREPVAFDVGPANALLDLVTRHRTGRNFDVDGALAAAGQVDTSLLDALLDDPFFALPPPKSTGREHFDRAYLDAALARAPVERTEDILATLTAAVARTVAGALRPFDVGRVLASGGGMRNHALVAALEKELGPTELRRSDEHGLPADAKEAYAFAILGFLTWHGVAANLPSGTGAEGPRLLGSITPGRRPLQLPPPARRPPRRLHVQT